MRRFTKPVFLFFVFCLLSINVQAEDYLTGSPSLILGPKTQRESSYTLPEVMNNFNIITNQDFTATAGMSGDLMSMLQTPQEIYTDSTKVLFYLRLMPVDITTTVILNPSGAIKIYLVNLQTHEETIGDYLVKTKDQPEKSEVFILNRENATPEIIYVLTLEDFGFSDSINGEFSLRLVYSNSSEKNNLWVGKIESNPINILIK